jgi:predicted alpha/beta hydrolase
MFAAGCGGGDASPKPSAEPSSPATQPTGSPAPAPASIGTAKGSVTFETSDGFTLAGRVFGDGPNGVILGHMGSPANSQGDWWTLAEQLAHRGYRVMTFNDRGICPDGAEGCSEGSIDFENAWRDLDAAAGFIRDHGVRKLVVGGGSLGAMAALYLAGRPGQTFDGVMSVSGIQNIDPYVLDRPMIEAIDEPKLFIVSRDDEVEATTAFRDWTQWARPPAESRLLPGAGHGSDLLVPITPDENRALVMFHQAVFGFLDRTLG